MRSQSDKCYYVYLWLRTAKSPRGDVGTPYYVGKGKGRRAYQSHQGIKPPSDRTRITIVAENLSEADAFQIEVLLIHFWGRIDTAVGCLRNHTNGGEGVSGLSAEGRAKISAKMKGRPNLWAKGRQVSPETRNRIRATLTGRVRGIEVVNKVSAGLRKRYQDHPEEIEKLRERAIQRLKDPQVREKLSIIAKEQWKDPEFREKSILSRLKTHCKNGHELAGDNLYIRRTGGRSCRACRNIHSENWRRSRRKLRVESNQLL